MSPRTPGPADPASADLASAVWRKSSHSGGSGNACVEVAALALGAVVAVRDSKTPDGPVLLVSRRAFADFVSAVRGGRLGG